MARLEWDRIEDRQYQLGVDRGVLYPADGGAAVAWNGLVSVDEDVSREVKSWYQDGVKFFEYAIPKPVVGKIQAFTYPDVLDTLMGGQMASGALIYDQPAKRFHLCYRSLVGNEADGVDHAYKIHILYNLIANPDSNAYATLGGQVQPNTFGWSVSSVPLVVAGMRPTSHISVDSRNVTAQALQAIEDALYGTGAEAPHILLPDYFT